jgi:hypothetical protein
MAIERIQLRRGTAQQWTDTDPILGAAEVGVELGTPNKFKIGDGASLWSELDYFSPSVSALPEYIPLTQKGVALGVATLDANGAIPTGQLANIISSAPEALDTLNELAAALADDANFASTITTELATKASASHTHTTSEITDFTAVLDNRDVLIQADISAVQDNVDAVSGNVTTVSDDLATLQGTVDSLDYAPSSHSHDASEITNTINTVVATTYTPTALDNGKLLVLDPAGGSITVTVDDVFTVGQRVDIYLRGTSASFVAGTGQIESIGTAMATQYTVASLMCIASGIYVLAGSVE